MEDGEDIYLVISETDSQERFVQSLFTAFVGPSAVFRLADNECLTAKHRYIMVRSGLFSPEDKASARVNLRKALESVLTKSCSPIQVPEKGARIIEVQTDRLLVLWLEFSRAQTLAKGYNGSPLQVEVGEIWW